LITVAEHTFQGKPLGILFTMRSGVPACYHNFWQQFDVDKLFRLYKALNASASSVLQSITEPEAMNAAEERMYQFLRTYISNMKEDKIRQFLRFVTGSAVLTSKSITITFNNLSGIQRHPIAHMCDCVLELPISYPSYPEFEHEFSVLMSEEMSWTMDSI